MTESEIQQLILLEATKLGHRLFRNNVGMTKYRDAHGDTRALHYGLGVGTSDLIGWTMRVAENAQSPRPIFTAVEIKTLKGRPTKEQLQFIEAVKKAGGIAGICRSVDDYQKLVGA